MNLMHLDPSTQQVGQQQMAGQVRQDAPQSGQPLTMEMEVVHHKGGESSQYSDRNPQVQSWPGQHTPSSNAEYVEGNSEGQRLSGQPYYLPDQVTNNVVD